MRAVIQRVREADVKVDGRTIGKIGKGYMILVGFSNDDNEEIISRMIKKILDLRIFEDEAGKMNLNIRDAGGEILSISQFTLYADCRKGNRPGFSDAAKAEDASRMYDRFNELLKEQIHTETGQFQADMKVSLVNDGPVTIILDSKEIIRN
ncbi:MAG: D-tyrosyl-tRNA(Tyr) deacylase [Erysipelotrichaceae bacterium]|nr:D-tyrosyl-tRNA(Tyr) deacylase [Erysipelotrichaceae bacterium]